MAITETNGAGEDVFSRLSAAIEQWRTAMTESRQRLAADIATSHAALEAARAETAAKADRAADVEALESRIAELEAALAALEAEARALEAECDRERAARVRAEAELAATRQALAESEARLVETAAAPRASDTSAEEKLPILGVPEIAATDGKGHKKRMGEILVDAGILTPEQLRGILREQSEGPHRRFGALVVGHGYASEDAIARVLAAQLQLPFVELDACEVEPQALSLISAHLARLHHCIPLHRDGGLLVAAMANPLDLIAIEDIELASRCRMDPIVATPRGIEAALDRFYPQEEE